MTGMMDPDALDQLLRRVDRSVIEAVTDGFDIEAGLAEVHRRAAAERTANASRIGQTAVGATMSAKTALVTEAERLMTVGVGWEDAEVRLAEIAELWPAAGDEDPERERSLWQRFIQAQEAFRQNHPRGVVVQTRGPRARTTEPSGTQDAAPNAPLSILEAEALLRQTLTGEGAAGDTWDVVERAATAYCISLVVAWLRTSHIPGAPTWKAPTRALLRTAMTADDMTAVATTAATGAVTRLRDHVIGKGGGWNLEGGTLLVDELVRGCVMAMPDALRAMAERRRIRIAGRALPPRAEPDADEAAFRMRADGYSRAEVAEVLRLPTEAAVTRAVRRHRERTATDNPNRRP